jgi:hypothetical protein
MDRHVAGRLGSSWMVMANCWWQMMSATPFGASTAPRPDPAALNGSSEVPGLRPEKVVLEIRKSIALITF